jgi:hypothetical protein
MGVRRYDGDVGSNNKKNMERAHRLITPVAIVLGATILGGFFYVTQISKQESIERQQRLELETTREENAAKQASASRTYIADRKDACLKIYTTESDKWNNVKGWQYNEEADRCYIEYKDPEPKTDEECDALYPAKGQLSNFVRNAACKDGTFEKGF